MESKAWKRDETPYYVFACIKCGRYLYVKTTQKNKKCFSCGRVHQVIRIKKNAETVNGITPANNIVKQRQNELAIKELGGNPDLRSCNEFSVAGHSEIAITKTSKKGMDEDEIVEENFKRLITDLFYHGKQT